MGQSHHRFPGSGPRALRASFIPLLLALTVSGCERKPQGYERFLPKTESARRAVTAAFEDWQNGRPPGVVAGTRPEVNVVDKHRVDGQRLKGFQILGEIAVQNARGFAVRVTLENPDEERVIHYVAIGIDPLWVFRQEDFDNTLHWMHKMESPAGNDESGN